MSFVFRGTRGDIESGFPGFIPERPAVRIHAPRPVNINSLAFLVTVLLLFMILNSHQMSPNFLLWLVVGVFLMATSLRMYATCQQLQAQARAHAAAASGLLGHTELRLHMPPSIAFATRGRLQGLRLQLALLDREFDELGVIVYCSATNHGLISPSPWPWVQVCRADMQNAISSTISKTTCLGPCFSVSRTGFLTIADVKANLDCDYDTLRALDSDNTSTTPSMSEEEINALPVHKYKVPGPESAGSSLQHPLSSSNPAELSKQESRKTDGCVKASEDELTCTICLEQVNGGELVRSLPCLHQFHANCIDPWLRQRGTCPVCKFKMVSGSGWQENRGSESDDSDMV
ncbi:hypothetical protein Patl1_31301 [Pistacia atlantica]|uniref:Uncharacterized protein n=1 Tax=Pistacia atlantica TaxID=434234 RepID=A0ACC1A8S6_9ROSI|nr:hypothetical protein Patl1_31301 [Pistacia atlantica]